MNAESTEKPAETAAADAAPPLLHRLTLATLVVYAIALVVGTHMPQEDGPPPVIPDKVLHFGAYLGLSWLLAMTLAQRGIAAARVAAITIPSLLLFGAIDEVTQIPVGRTADPLDWLADAAGILLGTGAAVVMATRWPKSFATAAARP